MKKYIGYLLMILICLVSGSVAYADNDICVQRDRSENNSTITDQYCFGTNDYVDISIGSIDPWIGDAWQKLPYVEGELTTKIHYYLIEGSIVGVLKIGDYYFYIETKPLH